MPATDATAAERQAFRDALVPSALAVLLPSDCASCGSPRRDLGGAGVCRGCWDSIAILAAGASCVRCALPGPPHVELCASCRHTAPPVERAVALGPYDGVLARVITAFKFRGLDIVAEPLALRLAAKATASGLDLRGARLVPIPSTAGRNRQRGFDPADLICRALARSAAATPSRVLRRRKETRPQSSLPLAERVANVEGAFAVRAGLGRRVAGADLFLVDDVVTTGATAFSAAGTLRRAGARSVGLLTVARTPESHHRSSRPRSKEPA